MVPRSKMVTFNQIKHKSISNNASPLRSKNWEVCQPAQWEEDDGEDIVDYSTSGILFPLAPLLPGGSGTGRYTTRWHSASLMSLSRHLQVWLFAKQIPFDSGIGHFCSLIQEPVLGLALLPVTEVKDLDEQSTNYCWVWARDQSKRSIPHTLI